MKNELKLFRSVIILLLSIMVICTGCGDTEKSKVTQMPSNAFSNETIRFDNNVCKLEIKNYSEYICVENRQIINSIIDRMNSLGFRKNEGKSAVSGETDLVLFVYEENKEEPYKFSIYSDSVASYTNVYSSEKPIAEVQEFQILLVECIDINSLTISDMTKEEMRNPEVKREMELARVNLSDYVDISINDIKTNTITYTIKETKKFDLLNNSELFGDRGFNGMVLDGRYTLEGFHEGDWADVRSYKIIHGGEIVPTGEVYPLGNTPVEIKTDWSNLGELEPGKYRLKKWVNLCNGEEYLEIGKETYYISIEFDIE